MCRPKGVYSYPEKSKALEHLCNKKKKRGPQSADKNNRRHSLAAGQRPPSQTSVAKTGPKLFTPTKGEKRPHA